MTLSVRRLTRILELIKTHLPWVEARRCLLPRNVANKKRAG